MNRFFLYEMLFENSPKISVTDEERNRFLSKIKKSECWLWTTGIDQDGYGQFSFRYKTVPAHRFAYELLKGQIPKDLQIDHLCRNRLCVNPDHLELVTLRENVRRGISPAIVNSKKTHCIHGHEFTPENTVARKRDSGNNYRACKECLRLKNIRLKEARAIKRKTRL